MRKGLFILLLFAFSCKPEPKTIIPAWEPYDETEEIAAQQEHESSGMRFKFIQSRNSDRNEIWADVQDQILYFGEEDYQALKPLIFEQDIPTIQEHIRSGDLTYEQLVQWYLYRIVQFENDPNKTLNTIIAINPNAVEEARQRDQNRSEGDHPIYGMPVLLKDNIGFEGKPTTAGAVVLKDNMASDAFITERIKEKGGIILGKVNLSEWANYLCDCPNGQSAIGGQTLNPYGRKIHDTGGSSAGSGTSMAANYAVAAVGTETSGSILSPSSSNSIVGLKPTIGLLSRDGIVPISSTLDTPGPMTRNVTDNAILLSAMSGEDPADPATKDNPKDKKYWEELGSANLKGMRFGVQKLFLEDSIYQLTVEKMADLGADTVHIQVDRVSFEGFLTFLNADMKADLPKYLKAHASDNITVKTVADVVEYNEQDTFNRIPYGQSLFEGIVAEDISEEEFLIMKVEYKQKAREALNQPMQEHNLNAILSINNSGAGLAAMAQYPCLTIPMGYRENGRPMGLTFIARQFEEDKLLKMGYAFEQATKARKTPAGYE
jgi:amidase